MNRVVNAHLRTIIPDDLRPDAPVFLGGGARPNARFQALCGLGGIKPRLNSQNGKEEPWGLRKPRGIAPPVVIPNALAASQPAWSAPVWPPLMTLAGMGGQPSASAQSGGDAICKPDPLRQLARFWHEGRRLSLVV